jgi:hypothetical protein
VKPPGRAQAGARRYGPVEPNPLVEYLRSTRGLDRDATEFLWRDAGSRVTLTAPHNKAVFRDGTYKRRDTNVGVVVVEAAKLAGVNALLPLTPGDDDGNWHEGSKFRSLLRSVVPEGATVIDVHGMTDEHAFDVVVGTCNDRTPEWLGGTVAEVFTGAGFIVDVRSEGSLSAGGRTVTAALLDSGRTAVQVEIARRWRDGRNDPAMMTILIETLAETARRVVTRSI